MEEKELRVGNLVNYILSNIPQEIKSIISVHGEYIVNFQNSEFSNTIDKIKPIPLTEEWLLKFGFKSNPYNDTYYLDNIYFEGCKLVFECNKTRGFTELWSDKFPLVENVHQLQNLFFILTGDDLHPLK